MSRDSTRGRVPRCAALLVLIAPLWAACGPGAPTPEAPGAPSPEAVPAAPDTSIAPAAPDTAVRDTTVALPEPDSVIAAVDTAAARPLRVCAGGDVLLGNNLDIAWAERASARMGRPVDPHPDPSRLLAPLRPLVADADVVLFNIEGAIGEGAAPSKCRPGSTTCYAFRQPVTAATALGRFTEPAAFVANVANNHAMDAGLDGFRATIRHLLEAGAYVTGADTLATVVPTPIGDTLAVLGFSTFRAGPDARDLSAVRRHVARAAERYPRVVVSVHMGAEGRDAQRTADASELFLGEDRGNPVAFAHAAVEGGAALVVGHGPHVLRAVEWRGDALIFYSLGNLLTYGPFNMREPANRGAIVCASLTPTGKVVEPVLRPTVQRAPGFVAQDLSGRATVLADSLSRLDFPVSGARLGADGTVLPPQPR